MSNSKILLANPPHRVRGILEVYRTGQGLARDLPCGRVMSSAVLLVTAAMLATSAFAAESARSAAGASRNAPADEATKPTDASEQKEGQPTEKTSAEGAAVYDGKTVDEWIAEFEKNNFRTNEQAKKKLISIGAPAVDALTRAVTERRKSAARSIQTLCQMGPDAEAALPVLLELAADRDAAQPADWQVNVPMRALIFSEARHMGWAAEKWVPILGRVAVDPEEPEVNRRRALYGLGGLGTKAEPLLRELAGHDDAEVRMGAIDGLANIAAGSGKDKNALYQEVIEQGPLDVNVPAYLVRLKNAYNVQQIHPLTQRVKSILRQQQDPTAGMYLALATIIRNGLANTDLSFAAPTDRVSSKWEREDPAESYASMEVALRSGFEVAEKGSDLAVTLGRSLARLQLLRGDFEGMNATLVRLGQKPVPADRRPFLPAPPFDWKDLHSDWQMADAEMRNGTSTVEFEFEKDGKGLQGAHVLIKHRPKPQELFYSGIPVDTLLHATQPLEARPYDAFGYRAADRGKTRYGVSDASGRIRLEKLPAVPIIIEVLVPTSNFDEPGHSWDLLMEIGGELRPAEWGQDNSVDRREGPAVIELKEGETIRYPKFVVRSQLILDVPDWSPADAETFVIKWRRPGGKDDRVDHYEIEMMLTAPTQHPDMVTQQRVIKSWTEHVRGQSLEVGKTGVDGGRLRPGNIYMFEVRAIDKRGHVTARLPRTRVWVPWQHRQSKPPSADRGERSGSPFYDRIWWRTNTQDALGNRETLPEAIARYVESNKDSFEYEYVLLGEAWLFHHDGLHDFGREQLEELVQELPKGNVVRGTARALLKLMAEGKPLPKRLEFVADE